MTDIKLHSEHACLRKMLVSGKVKTVTCVVIVICVLQYFFFFHMLNSRITPWKRVRFSAKSFKHALIFQRLSKIKTAAATHATVHLPHKPIVDNPTNSSVTTSGPGMPRGDAQDTVEPVKGNSSNRLQAHSSTLDCSPTDQKRVHTALNGSRLPEDLTYMPLHVCSHQQPPPPDLKTKLIVNLNREEWKWLFPDGKFYENVFKTCTYKACKFTDDKRLLPEADAVFVYSCRIKVRTPPPRASSKQIWIAYAMESPIHYYGLHDSPAWKNVFNWTMGYRPDSDIFSPYGTLQVRFTPSVKNYTSIALKKSKSVAWFVTNCHTQSKRQMYVKKLQNHIDVDIYGGCSHKKCSKNQERDCLRLLNTTYYFYLSFENSICKDYMTEKFFKVFNNVDVVPIVRGGANYSRYFPPGTYLNTADYPSPGQLAAHLKTIIAHPQTYARLLETKDRFTTDTNNGHGFCDLCKRLHTSGSMSKVYPDFMKWTRDKQCHEPSDLSKH